MSERVSIRQTIFVLRIVLGALIAGVVFMAVVAVLVMEPAPNPEREPMWLANLAVLAIAVAIAHVVVRRAWMAQLERRTRGDSPEDAEPTLLSVFQLQTIFGAALTEAVSLFAVVTYMLTASQPALFVAGVGVLLLLFQIPSADRYRRFADRVLDRGLS